MQALASGDLSVTVPHRGQRTEIGTIADAVQVFKGGLVRMKTLEAEAAQARLAAEEHRKRVMREMADGFEAAVGGVIGMVSSSATELQATAQQLTSTASQTASQSNAVAAAAEEAPPTSAPSPPRPRSWAPRCRRSAGRSTARRTSPVGRWRRPIRPARRCRS